MKKGIIISVSIIVIIILGFVATKLFSTPKNSYQTQSPNSVSTPASTKSISLTEIASHKDVSSCWMAIDGNVYDVTPYIPNHQGGDQILLGCGKDATDIFNNRPSDGTSHSNRAYQILSNYQIGVLAK